MKVPFFWFVLLASSSVRGFLSPLYRSQPTTAKRKKNQHLPLITQLRDSNAGSEGIHNDPQDWRSFRAMLVEKEHQQQEGGGNAISLSPPQHQTTTTTMTKKQSWIHEQTIIEIGSVILQTPLPEEIYGLNKQHLYRSVILLIDHNPSETIGILLNRPTDIMPPKTVSGKCLYYGGDEQSIHSTEPLFWVLHASSQKREEGEEDPVGVSILPGLQLSNMDDIHPMKEEYSVFSGFVAFDTKELEYQISQESWKLLSIDAQTIMSNVGENCYSRFLPQQEEERFTTNGYYDFNDRMYQGWQQQYQIRPARTTITEMKHEKKASLAIKEGDILRSKCQKHGNDYNFIFENQHLYKSIVLIVQEDDEFTVGVILNHPTQQKEYVTSNPIRYGGDFGYIEVPPLCVHYNCDDAFADAEIIGDGPFYKSSIEEMQDALELDGTLSCDDFFVIQGMSVWPKDDDENGEHGLESEHDGCFEIVSPDRIHQVWQKLTGQTLLSSSSIESNVDIAHEAWLLAEDKEEESTIETGGELSEEKCTDIASLATAAVTMWLARNTLIDTEYKP